MASVGFMPFVERLESSSLQHSYMFFTRRIIQSEVNYQLVRCFLDIQDGSYKECFLDFTSPDGFTTPSTSVFCWLINIRPGYLVFWQGDTCMIEPYMPSQFARQFGNNQLYVRNPNTNLCFRRNLFEGARAWNSTWLEGRKRYSIFHNEHPTSILGLVLHLVCHRRHGVRLRDQHFVHQGHKVHL